MKNYIIYASRRVDIERCMYVCMYVCDSIEKKYDMS